MTLNSMKNTILTNKFIKLIEENHQQIVERYMNDVLKNENTTAYRNLDRQKVYEMGDDIYRELSLWMTKSLKNDEIDIFYHKLGELRLSQGVPATQVFYAIVLLKRHMWFFVNERMENDITDYKQVVDLINRVLTFFDRAIFSMLAGYENELNKKW
jgi:hypothetical protein